MQQDGRKHRSRRSGVVLLYTDRCIRYDRNTWQLLPSGPRRGLFLSLYSQNRTVQGKKNKSKKYSSISRSAVSHRYNATRETSHTCQCCIPTVVLRTASLTPKCTICGPALLYRASLRHQCNRRYRQRFRAQQYDSAQAKKPG